MKPLDPASADLDRYRDILAWLAGMGIRPRVYRDDRGVIRFRINPILRDAISERRISLNGVAASRNYTTEDRAELYTLFDYSLDGFAEVFSEELDEFNRSRGANEPPDPTTPS
jgi:hypothetical protein